MTVVAAVMTAPTDHAHSAAVAAAMHTTAVAAAVHSATTAAATVAAGAGFSQLSIARPSTALAATARKVDLRIMTLSCEIPCGIG